MLANGPTWILRILILTMAWCASFCHASTLAAPPTKDESLDKYSGAYEVIVRGTFTGKGTIVVGAKSVAINLLVTNDSGQNGHLIVPNLELKNGTFVGTGTVHGVTMKICGRIDLASPSGPPRAACLLATFSVNGSSGGRIVGTRRGG